MKTEGARRVTQEMHEQEYQQALITIKDKIRDNEGPDMKESMQDQIRQWFIEVRSVRQSSLLSLSYNNHPAALLSSIFCS